MAITVSSITDKVRYLIQDFAKSTKDIFTAGNSSIFTLTEDNPVSITAVYKNSTELSSGQWSFDSSTNKVTISTTVNAGDIIEIDYTYYPTYSTSEITGYINSALIIISSFSYYTWSIENDNIYPEPNTEEQNLIALVASILINPNNKSFSLPNIKVNVPKDLPTTDKINKIISIFKHNSSGIFEVL